jgi:hypothetical protein
MGMRMIQVTAVIRYITVIKRRRYDEIYLLPKFEL